MHQTFRHELRSMRNFSLSFTMRICIDQGRTPLDLRPPTSSPANCAVGSNTRLPPKMQVIRNRKFVSQTSKVHLPFPLAEGT